MKQYFYLIHFQYLGFRYHGWQKQPGQLTIELMIEKTLKFILPQLPFKLLAASRTDAKVSAACCAFQLFVSKPLDTGQLMADLNINLPNDIRILGIEEKDKTFNIINGPKTKEYLYLFSFGEKCHPFCAPLLSAFSCPLDIELMKQGARLFEGTHNFIRYCTKPTPHTNLRREVLMSRIDENTMYQASFFPKKTYAYVIQSRGFLRYQVRLIVGQLLSLGRGEIDLDEIRRSLTGRDTRPLRHIAPASGLILNRIEFM